MKVTIYSTDGTKTVSTTSNPVVCVRPVRVKIDDYTTTEYLVALVEVEKE